MKHADAIALGARCTECYLYPRNDGGPVPSEYHPGSDRCAIVSEAPSSDEVKVERPLVGRDGDELMRALWAFGYKRADVAILNTLLCRPPGNELPRLLAQWQKENRRRKKEKLPLLPSPMECCKPRLLRELGQFDQIITLGKIATQTVLGSDAPILDLRGGPVQGLLTPQGVLQYEDEEDAGLLEVPEGARPVKVLPTVHPRLVLHQRRWQSAFRIDIGRALRWFTGKLGWTDPKIVVRPSVEELERFLKSRQKFFAYDLETTREGPLRCALYCCGIGVADLVHVVPFHSKEQEIDRSRRGVFYTEAEYDAIWELFRWFFGNPKILKVGHNIRVFDNPIVKRIFGVEPTPTLCTLTMHRGVESELPHNLGYVGTTYTDVTAWKADKAGTEAKTDKQLHKYNGTDTCVTARIVPPLDMSLEAKGQWDVVKKDHKVLKVCAGLQEIGLRVNPKVRDAFNVKLLKEIYAYRTICRDALGRDSFNPGSFMQVADVLYDDWGFAPHKLSDLTGEPSTDDDCLRYYRVNYSLTDKQKRFIEALRRYRLAVKLRGTCVVKFKSVNEAIENDGLWEDVDEDPEDRKIREKKDEKKQGLIHEDGRFHSSWNQLTTSGRMNSKDPAAQNWKKWLREMIIPEDNCPHCGEHHVFVGADMDQLEMRFGAARWGMPLYLAAFNEGRDAHAETAFAVFGDQAKKTYADAILWAQENGTKPKEYPAWQRMRDFAKIFYYATQYWANVETVHDILSSVEDDKGNLVYADVTLATARERHANLLETHPELPAGWEKELAFYRRHGKVTEPIWGRDRYLLDGEDESTIVNHPIQSGGAAIVHDATFEIQEQIPFQKWCPKTGLVLQGHDALMYEVPMSKAEWARDLIQRHMTRQYPGLPVTFTAEGKIGINKNPKKGEVGRRSWLDC